MPRHQSPEDVREGIVRGGVTIKLPSCVLCELPPQILYVLLSVQLKVPLDFCTRTLSEVNETGRM